MSDFKFKVLPLMLVVEVSNWNHHYHVSWASKFCPSLIEEARSSPASKFFERVLALSLVGQSLVGREVHEFVDTTPPPRKRYDSGQSHRT